MFQGFFRAVSCSPRVAVADVEANTAEILRMLGEAAASSPDMVVFPEMALTAYTCAGSLGV